MRIVLKELQELLFRRIKRRTQEHNLSMMKTRRTVTESNHKRHMDACNEVNNSLEPNFKFQKPDCKLISN